MDEGLKLESEKLVRSWEAHPAGWLGSYLVAGVEDPRVNVQSILSRHFLVRALSGERFGGLMAQEYRFAAALHWLLRGLPRGAGAEDFASILYALERGSDNAEGLEIPLFLVQAFAQLPCVVDGLSIPNYIAEFLSRRPAAEGGTTADGPALNTFQELWREALDPARFQPLGPTDFEGDAQAKASEPPGTPPMTRIDSSAPSAVLLSLMEPACGSANDYRFLRSYGIAYWFDYTGFDLCAKNVQNARALFPGIRFDLGNAFEINAPDKSCDLCLVHDLLEHLSLDGLRAAAGEICRVTRQAICLGFFQMDEVRDHVVRPVDDYHWNLLSMRKMKELFARHGFAAQVIHIGTFLDQQAGCGATHNPNAYTFILHACNGLDELSPNG